MFGPKLLKFKYVNISLFLVRSPHTQYVRVELKILLPRVSVVDCYI